MNIIINPLCLIDDITRRTLALLDADLRFTTDLQALRSMIQDTRRKFIITSVKDASELHSILITSQHDDSVSYVILVGPQGHGDMTLEAVIQLRELQRS